MKTDWEESFLVFFGKVYYTFMWVRRLDCVRLLKFWKLRRENGQISDDHSLKAAFVANKTFSNVSHEQNWRRKLLILHINESRDFNLHWQCNIVHIQNYFFGWHNVTDITLYLIFWTEFWIFASVALNCKLYFSNVNRYFPVKPKTGSLVARGLKGFMMAKIFKNILRTSSDLYFWRLWKNRP